MQIPYLSSRRYQRLVVSELIVFFSIVICVGLGWFYVTDKYLKTDSPVGVLSIVPAELKLSSYDDSDQQREVTCRLINRSSVSYRIKNVATSCACTLTEPLSVSEVLPGSEVVLRLRASIPKHGTKEVMVRVETIPALEQMPSLRLVLSGQKRQLPYIESLPLPLRLTGNVGGEWVTHKYDLVTVEAAGSPAWIDNIHGTQETIKAVLNIPPTETEFVPGSVKRTYQIDVSGLVPDSVEQRHSSNLVINTSTQFSTSLL